MALDHGPRGMAALQALYHVLTKPIVGAAPSTVSVTAEGVKHHAIAHAAGARLAGVSDGVQKASQKVYSVLENSVASSPVGHTQV